MTSGLFVPFIVAAAACTGAAQAAIVHTSRASFDAATTASATDAFDGFDVDSKTSSPTARTVGGYSYTATATSGFYGAGSGDDPALTVWHDVETIILTDFDDSVGAVGGSFYGTRANGQYRLGDLLVTLVDGDGTTSVTLVGASEDGFVGFTSRSGIVSLSIAAVASDVAVFPTVDDLVIAQAAGIVSAVPEPTSWVMLLIGFGMIATTTRYRRRAARTVYG